MEFTSANKTSAVITATGSASNIVINHPGGDIIYNVPGGTFINYMVVSSASAQQFFFEVQVNNLPAFEINEPVTALDPYGYSGAIYIPRDNNIGLRIRSTEALKITFSTIKI